MLGGTYSERIEPICRTHDCRWSSVVSDLLSWRPRQSVIAVNCWSLLCKQCRFEVRIGCLICIPKLCMNVQCCCASVKASASDAICGASDGYVNAGTTIFNLVFPFSPGYARETCVKTMPSHPARSNRPSHCSSTVAAAQVAVYACTSSRDCTVGTDVLSTSWAITAICSQQRRVCFAVFV